MASDSRRVCFAERSNVLSVVSDISSSDCSALHNHTLRLRHNFNTLAQLFVGSNAQKGTPTSLLYEHKCGWFHSLGKHIK